MEGYVSESSGNFIVSSMGGGCGSCLCGRRYRDHEQLLEIMYSFKGISNLLFRLEIAQTAYYIHYSSYISQWGGGACHAVTCFKVQVQIVAKKKKRPQPHQTLLAIPTACMAVSNFKEVLRGLQ